MTKIKFILFDLDGTLVHSIPDLTYAINRTMSDMGYDEVTEREMATWVGNGAPMIIARSLSHDITPSAELSDALKEQAETLFYRYYHESNHSRTHLFDGVLPALETFKQQGIQMAIITSKPAQFVPEIMQKLGLNDYFTDVIGGDQVKNRKPDPESLFLLMKKYDFLPEECLMVGDSRNDILAAHNAGCPSLGYTFGYNYGEPISDSQPTYVCDKFSDIIQVVEGYPKNII